MSDDPQHADYVPLRLVAFLNELVQQEPQTLHALVETRVPCGPAMVAHPTVQVAEPPPGQSGDYLGVVGVLNGWLRRCYDETLEAMFTGGDRGQLTGFRLRRRR